MGSAKPGFGSWAHAIKQCARGGAGWSQKAKPSHWDLVLANGMWGASISGRGDLGGVGEVQLWGVGVVIGLVSSRGAGFAHLVTFSPLSFPIPFPLLTPPSLTL